MSKRRYGVATHKDGQLGPWIIGLGEYDDQWPGPTIELTDRQRQAIEEAVYKRNDWDAYVARNQIRRAPDPSTYEVAPSPGVLEWCGRHRRWYCPHDKQVVI